MKTISIVVPTYNEESNVFPLYSSIIEHFKIELPSYDYEIIFIDNYSNDNTRENLRKICKSDERVKAIFNARNFGQIRSPYFGLTQASGDCAILMCADFQDPVEMIALFVKEWEKGFKIVVGVKANSYENKLIYLLRGIYYKMLRRIAEIEHIEHFTGFGLYDRSFLTVLSTLDDPIPYLRGIVAELGFEHTEIKYKQPKRKSGKSKNNFFSLYDYAMIGITSYSKALIRVLTFCGFIVAGICFLIGLTYLILKLIYWDRYLAGSAPIVVGIFFLGGVQLVFMGLIGEYILSINTRVMKRPLVIVEERLNFDSQKKSSQV